MLIYLPINLILHYIMGIPSNYLYLYIFIFVFCLKFDIHIKPLFHTNLNISKIGCLWGAAPVWEERRRNALSPVIALAVSPGTGNQDTRPSLAQQPVCTFKYTLFSKNKHYLAKCIYSFFRHGSNDVLV